MAGPMGFMGGSAPAMASQICEGFILVSLATLKGLTAAELNMLRAEVEKLLREVRATTPAGDDAPANQVRNRKIARLSSAMQVVSAKLVTRSRS
jgi:hypothetical protein